MGTVNSKSEIDASHDLRNLSVGGARCQHSRFQGQTNRLQNGADSELTLRTYTKTSIQTRRMLATYKISNSAKMYKKGAESPCLRGLG